MNREREFRAWLIDEKKMVEVDAINFKSEVIFYTVDKEIDGEIIDTLQTRFFKEIELMQYTELKDRNDVKIFEGDIVRRRKVNVDKYLEDRTIEYNESVGVITWDEERLKYYIQKNSNEYECEDVLKLFKYTYEVIGNIYENKELLEVKDEKED